MGAVPCNYNYTLADPVAADKRTESTSLPGGGTQLVVGGDFPRTTSTNMRVFVRASEIAHSVTLCLCDSKSIYVHTQYANDAIDDDDNATMQ